MKKKDKTTNKSLNSIYKFMADTYHGNWQYRWGKTPWMQKHIKIGRNESISGHQWACIGFWFHLSRVCPSLEALVDTKEIYERLWSHDLGETFEGDVPQFDQLSGRGVNKHITERKEIEKMGKQIPRKILKQMLDWFTEFEEDFENMDNLEVLVAKFIDTVQGNHYAVVFGNNLSEHSQAIDKIVGRSLIPIATRLLEILRQRGHKKAHQEVMNVTTHLLKFFKKAGVKINFNIYSK